MRDGLIRSCLLLFLTGMMAASCTATRVELSHPLLRPNTDGLAATVYFIRPRSERTMGAADNRIQVEVEGHHLMAMAKGEYTRLRLIPGSIRVKVTSDTTWGPSQNFARKTHSKTFVLAPAQTYYLVFSLVDGEFRGAYYKPEMIDLAQARGLIVGAVAVGDDARNMPIRPFD